MVLTLSLIALINASFNLSIQPFIHSIIMTHNNILYSFIASKEPGDVSSHPAVRTESPSVRHHWLPGQLSQTHHQKTQWHWEGGPTIGRTGRGVDIDSGLQKKWFKWLWEDVLFLGNNKSASYVRNQCVCKSQQNLKNLICILAKYSLWGNHGQHIHLTLYTNLIH